MLKRQVTKAVLAGAIATLLVPTIGPAFTPSAQAQEVSPFNPRSLSASGNWRMTVPASQTMLIFPFERSYSYDAEGALEEQTDVQTSDLQPIVDALISSGVAASDIDVYKDAYSTQSVRLFVQVADSNRQSLNAVIDVVEGVDLEKLSSLGPVGAVHGINDCETHETVAREEAIAAAKKKAQTLASATDVTLGELMTVSESVYWENSGPYTPGCPDNFEEIVQFAIAYQATQFYNPALEPEVPLTVSVSFTYAME